MATTPTSSTGAATSSTGTPTFTVRTMSKGELAACYGLKRPQMLLQWCQRVGITLPPRVHLLDPGTVALIVEKLGAPTITISAARM